MTGGDELVDVLEWLSPALYDSRHNEIKHQRIKGTGMWLLETSEYKRWRSESDAPSFLWCYGGPGTGKTFLTYGRLLPIINARTLLIGHRSLVLDELLSAVGNADIGVAYIYLDYADRQAQTLDNIISSLAKQLSLWKKGNEDIKTLYEQCQRGKSRPDLSKLEATLKTVCNRFKQVFFVLDALDECEDNIRRLLLAQLKGLEKSRCRYFLTSRPHLQDLRRNLCDYPKIEIKAQDLDIKLLIQKRIEDDAMLSELVEDNKPLEVAIVDETIKNAKDM